MPKVSVIVPVYNVEKYLAACLDSIIAQTITDIEIICVNDGSKDNSATILDEYTQKDKRIKIITQKNKGLSGARNSGIKAATGEYTCFVDSDDRIPSYALKTLLQIAEATRSPVVMSEKVEHKPVLMSGAVHWQLHTDVMADFVQNRHIFSSAWNKLYRTDLVKNHPFIEGIYFEDWPFLTTLMGQIQQFATTDIPCYIYRNDNDSITRSSFNTRKVDSYITGIHFVYESFQNKLDLIWAQKRMAVAAKMLINKVYHTRDKNLYRYTVDQLESLFKKKILFKRLIPFKSLFRYWLMKR